jgi:3-methyladenine DNA glycosylase/8-oxoguanine DNA glycosylase
MVAANTIRNIRERHTLDCHEDTFRKNARTEAKVCWNHAETEDTCEAYSYRKLGPSERRELLKTIKWTLSLKEDIRPFYRLAKHDPLVEVLVKDLYGMRNTKQPDIFPRLILAVTLQMAPITRSNQMMNLLIREYGERMRFDGKEILYWPSPERANADVRELEKSASSVTEQNLSKA